MFKKLKAMRTDTAIVGLLIGLVLTLGFYLALGIFNAAFFLIAWVLGWFFIDLEPEEDAEATPIPEFDRVVDGDGNEFAWPTPSMIADDLGESDTE